jgi:hypothetical protein
MLGTVAGGTQYMDPEARAPRAFFDQVNLDSGEVRRIPIGFLGHGFTQDPTSMKRAALFEKKGPGGAIVDLDELVVIEAIHASPGSTFMATVFSRTMARRFMSSKPRLDLSPEKSRFEMPSLSP